MKNTHIFCIGEVIGQTLHIRRTKQIKLEGDSPLFVESRQQNYFCCKGHAACCSTNLYDYDSISNRALKQAWLVGFKKAQHRALDVELKVLLSDDKWDNPWSSLFTNSLNIIGCCSLEVNEDDNVVANDMLVNCVGHESCSRDDKGVVMVTCTTTSVSSA